MKKIIFLVLILSLFTTGCGVKEPIQLQMPKSGDEIVEMEVEGYGFIRFKLLYDNEAITELFKGYYSKGEYENISILRNIPERIIHLGDFEKDLIISNLNEEVVIDNNKKYAAIRGSISFLFNNEGYTQMMGIVLNNSEGKEEIEFNKEKLHFSKFIEDMYVKYGGISEFHNSTPIIGQIYEGMEILDKINEEYVDPNYINTEEMPKIIRIEIKKYGE